MNLELSRKNSESRNHKNVEHIRNQLEPLKSKKRMFGVYARVIVLVVPVVVVVVVVAAATRNLMVLY